MSVPPSLVLASTSRYRRELLERLKLAFEVHSPEVDESPIAGETPAKMAQRLALAKAEAVAQRFPGGRFVAVSPDGDYLATFARGAYQGIAEEHYVEFDGPGAEWAKLADVGRPGDKSERYRLYAL